MSSGVRGGLSSESRRPEVSAALNVKLGRVEAVLRWDEAADEGMSMCMEDEAGRRLGIAEVCCHVHGWVGEGTAE